MITIKTRIKSGPGLITWESGQPRDAMEKAADLNVIDWLEATNPELDVIRLQFGNLRSNTSAEVVKWFNDDAQFIAANI